jgi:hypothetical protein
MSAVVVAIFSSFSDAESVFTELIRKGFPRGRVKLTASHENGGMSRQLPESSCGQYEHYFETFFGQAGEREFVEELARRVASGFIATIAVHPHGAIETSHATEILENQGALQVVPRELESAAFPDTRSWLDCLIPEHAGAAGRFCFRSFPDADAEQ